MSRLLHRLSAFGVLLTLLAALSLAAAGGAHRIAPQGTAEALALVYGQDAQICGAVGGGSGLSQDCPVCHLVSAVVLAEPAALSKPQVLRFAEGVRPAQAQRAAETPLDPAHATRAPPLV